MLTQESALEDCGMIIRKVYPQLPPKVEYTLSDMGKDFTTVLDSLKIWGEKYISNLSKEV